MLNNNAGNGKYWYAVDLSEAECKTASMLHDNIYYFFANATPFSKHMTNKSLTPRQKLINKHFIRGREHERALNEDSAKRSKLAYESEQSVSKTLRRELQLAQAKIESLSGLLQAIHTTAQAGGDIMRIK